jgi:hypothetical protein
MLYSIDSGQCITSIPHKPYYNTCRSRLSESEYDAIMNDLHGRIEGDEIVTSSWIPGSDLEGYRFRAYLFEGPPG